jgi:hypothetical protein
MRLTFLMPCCSENKVKGFEVKVIVCLYLTDTNSENSFSNPFQRPYMGDFDRVKIHNEFGGGFSSNIFINNR